MWKLFETGFEIDSVQLYFFTVLDDTILKVELEMIDTCGGTTVKMDDDTKHFGTDVCASVVLKDSSIVMTHRPYTLDVETKGSGGNIVYYVRMFMSQ